MIISIYVQLSMTTLKQEFKLSLLVELSTDWDVAQREQNGPMRRNFYWKASGKNWFWGQEVFSRQVVMQNSNKEGRESYNKMLGYFF